MRRRGWLSLVVIVVVLLGASGWRWWAGQKQTEGVLRVDTLPKGVAVFLDGQKRGSTPLQLEKVIAGEHELKVGEGQGVYWEGKLTIAAGTLTYVSREMGPTAGESGGQVLELEKLPAGASPELAVVSEPDGAGVLVDAVEKGKAALLIKDLTVGDHVVVISAPDYADQVIQARLAGGFRLNAFVKLRRGREALGELAKRPTAELIMGVATMSAAGRETITKPYATIMSTPLGFLRVRSDPDFMATEAGKVYPQEKYSLISETWGWVQIKLPFPATPSGWVSNRYVEITR